MPVKKKDVSITMFVKDGCGGCKAAKQRVGGLLEDLSDLIDVKIITTNPQIVAQHNLQYAPTMRFNETTTNQLVGGQITPDAIFDAIRQLRFGKPAKSDTK